MNSTCHSETLEQAEGLAWTVGRTAGNCHPECNEGSSGIVTGEYRAGFFTSFRMTGTGVDWQRSEESTATNVMPPTNAWILPFVQDDNSF